MKLYYAMEGKHRATFPHSKVPKDWIRSWCPPSNEINLPRVHPKLGTQNGGQLRSGQLSNMSHRSKNPLEANSVGLVMLDAEWSIPQDCWDLAFVAGLKADLKETHPTVRFGMYHHAQPAGYPVVDYTVLHGYVGKPTMFRGALELYWTPANFEKSLQDTLKTRVAGVPCVMAMHRNYIQAHRDQPIGDWEMCSVIDAALSVGADIMVWDANNATTENDAQELHSKCVAFMNRISKRLDGVFG